GQLEADTPVIILLRRRLQVKLGQCDFAVMARREVIERLAHYRVILNLRLMTILENQHGLRLVGWSFDWFRCRRRLSLFLILPRTVSIVWPRTPRQFPGAATIENCRPTAVIFFVLRIVYCRLDCDRIRNRVNGSAYWKERVVVVMMPMVEKPRRVSGARKQRINAAIRCGEKLDRKSTRLNSSHRTNLVCRLL